MADGDGKIWDWEREIDRERERERGENNIYYIIYYHKRFEYINIKNEIEEIRQGQENIKQNIETKQNQSEKKRKDSTRPQITHDTSTQVYVVVVVFRLSECFCSARENKTSKNERPDQSARDQLFPTMANITSTQMIINNLSLFYHLYVMSPN